MFDRELKDIFDTIVYSHTKYAKTITKSELAGVFNDRNPAMPDSLYTKLAPLVHAGDIWLVKGSLGSKVHKIVDKLVL